MRQEDHFFLAALRWVSRNEVTSLALVCHRSRPLPMGSKRRPAIEMWGCLHEVPLYRLVDLYLAGVRDIALIQGDCCAHQDTVASWNSRLGDLVHLSEMAGTPARSWAWSISPTRIPVDRRGLLGLSRQSENPWPVHDPEADDEARLIASLRNAGITTVDAPPPGVQLLASGCTGCGVCIAACPHDALALRIDGAETRLEHSSDVCQGEQQCVTLCPVEALTVGEPLTWPTVLEGTPHVLATLQMSVCERCKVRFPTSPGQRWCETCRIRRSDPFGSHLPEAAIKLLRARGHNRPL